MKQRQIAVILVVIFVIGVLFSAYLVITGSNWLFKNDNFHKNVLFESGTGYIYLKRNIDTPSALDWTSFKNGQNYLFFSHLEGFYIEEKVFFKLPESVEKGTYYVDYEIRYITGSVEGGTLSFKV